jgi:transcriptional regulator GlxA family with amidase domain
MNSKVRAIVEFMRNNLQQRCTLRQFAEIARLSERQVIELFQAEFQLPPCAYFKNLRLEKARNLLASSALPVKEVRFIVGYQDASDFTRDFKKKYGVAPSIYRESLYFQKNESAEDLSQF